MSTSRNIAANFIGQGWAAVLGVVFVPVYASVLGVEAYGLVGAFVILYAGLSILDAGVSLTLAREMAHVTVGTRTVSSVRDLLRSLEWLCGAVALTVVIAIWLSTTFLSRTWLNAESVSETTVVTALKIMAPLLASRWMEQIYRGALQGLGDFIWINVAHALFATLRWAGACIVIVYVDTSVEAFFGWQLVVSIAALSTLIYRTYSVIPISPRPAVFSFVELRKVGAYASGLFAVSISTFFLTQIDRLAVSSYLSLEQLGVYSIASAAAGGLAQIVTPINSAIYPRLTQLIAWGDQTGLRQTYIRSCELMAWIIVPPALLMSLFPQHVLVAWSGDLQLAGQVAPILMLLSLGALCNAVMNPPYMMQLAHSWTTLALWINTAAIVVAVPSVLWATPRYGTVGAASVWVILNATYVVLGSYLMHRRLVPDLRRRWYLRCVAYPVVACAIAAASILAFAPGPTSRITAIAVCMIALAIMYPVTALSLGGIRWMTDMLKTFVRRQ